MYTFGRFCKVCVRETDNLFHLTTRNDFDITVNFSDLLSIIYPKLLTLDSTLPHFICLKCRNQLIASYKFYKKCQHSYRTLRSYTTLLKTENYCQNFPAKSKKRKFDQFSGYNQETSREIFFEIKRLKYYNNNVSTYESRTYSSKTELEELDFNIRPVEDFDSNATTIILDLSGVEIEKDTQSVLDLPALDPREVEPETNVQSVLELTALDQSVVEPETNAQSVLELPELDQSEVEPENNAQSVLELPALDQIGVEPEKTAQSVLKLPELDQSGVEPEKTAQSVLELPELDQNVLEATISGEIAEFSDDICDTTGTKNKEDTILQILNKSTEEEIQKLIETNSYEISLKNDILAPSKSTVQKKEETLSSNIKNILKSSEADLQKYIESNSYEISLHDIEEHARISENEENTLSSEELLQKYIQKNSYKISLNDNTILSSKDTISSKKIEDNSSKSHPESIQEPSANVEDQNGCVCSLSTTAKKSVVVSQDFSFNLSNFPRNDSPTTSEYSSDGIIDSDYVYSELYDFSGLQEVSEASRNIEDSEKGQQSEEMPKSNEDSLERTVKVELDILEPTTLDYPLLDLATIKKEIYIDPFVQENLDQSGLEPATPQIDLKSNSNSSPNTQLTNSDPKTAQKNSSNVDKSKIVEASKQSSSGLEPSGLDQIDLDLKSKTVVGPSTTSANLDQNGLEQKSCASQPVTPQINLKNISNSSNQNEGVAKQAANISSTNLDHGTAQNNLENSIVDGSKKSSGTPPTTVDQSGLDQETQPRISQNCSNKNVPKSKVDTSTNLDQKDSNKQMTNDSESQPPSKNKSNVSISSTTFTLDANIIDPTSNIHTIPTIVTSPNSLKKVETKIIQTSFVNNIVLSPKINYSSGSQNVEEPNSTSSPQNVGKSNGNDTQNEINLNVDGIDYLKNFLGPRQKFPKGTTGSAPETSGSKTNGSGMVFGEINDETSGCQTVETAKIKDEIEFPGIIEVYSSGIKMKQETIPGVLNMSEIPLIDLTDEFEPTTLSSGTQNVTPCQNNNISSTSPKNRGPKHFCQLCNKYLNTKLGFDLHMYEKHTSKCFSCNQCPQTFKRRSSFFKHIQMHNRKNRYSSGFPETNRYFARPQPNMFRTPDLDHFPKCPSPFPENIIGLPPKCRNCWQCFRNYPDFKYHILLCNHKYFG